MPTETGVSPGGKAPRYALAIVVAITTAVQALASMAVLLVPTLAPEIARDLGLEPSLVGYQIGLAYVWAMLASVVSGTLVRRFGACRTSQLALALFALGLGLFALATPVGLAAGSVTIGLGYGVTNPAASHLLIRHARGTRLNLIFSIKQTGVPIGGAMAGLIGPGLALALGWQGAVLAVAVVCAGLGLALEPLRGGWDADRDSTVRLGRGPMDDARLVWTEAPLRWLAMTSFAFTAAQMVVFTYAVTLMVTELGFGLIEAGAVFAVVQASGVVGRLIWGWLADRIGDGTAVLAGLGLAAAALFVAIALLDAGWPVALVVLVLSLTGVTAVGWNGVFFAEIARRAPEGRIGSATGGALVVTYAGAQVGPPLFAVAAAAIGGYGPTFALFALASLAGTVFVLLGGRSVR